MVKVGLFSFLIWLGALLAQAPAFAADPVEAPVVDHDDLTRRWRPADYRLEVAPSLTCGICARTGVAGLTTAGCARFFPGGQKGFCTSCLFQDGLIPYLLGRGMNHSHTLPDGTQHTCLITGPGILDLADRGGLDELPADPRLELIRQRKAVLRQLEQARGGNHIRKLHQERRALDWQIRELPPMPRREQVQTWLASLREACDALAGSRARLAALDGICRTCGRYPRKHEAASVRLRQFEDGLRAQPGRTSGFWPQACPACLSYLTLQSTRACSIITCDACLRQSGMATRFCVVCRRTHRGEDQLFPGKERFNHDECVRTMRDFAHHPEDAGCFELCECKEAE